MATIYDVARRAGVSHTAVSAVINGNKKHEVGAEKQRKILEAIQELGYVPSRIARQLATGKSNVIGLCFGSPFKHVFVHPTNSLIIAGIGESVSEHDYDLFVKPTTAKVGFQQVIADLPSHGLGGIVIVGVIPLKKETLEAIDNCAIPVVCIDSYQGFSRASTLDTDNVGASAHGTRHLISLGHRKITYVGRPPVHQCFADRMRGFCEALQEHDIPVDMNSVRTHEKDHALRLLEEILQLQDRPTALVCADENYANAAGKAISNFGMRIPDDIALVTFDNPPQTGVDPEKVNVIRVDAYKMGTTAAELLIKLLNGEVSGPVNVRIPAQFDFKA